MKRILSLLLVLTMLCSLCTVFAQEEAPAEETAAGETAETVPEEPAAEETAEEAAEPAEAAAEEPAAEETPAEEPAAETPAEEPAEEEIDAEPAADGTDAFGTCGDALTWYLDAEAGVLTISGDGTMADYENNNTPWLGDGNSIKSIVIGDNVTSIGSYAFEQTNLQEMTIPAGITSIGMGAFYICPYMTTVTILGNITSIPQYTFSFCNALKSVTIPASVTSIGSTAFFKCVNLTDVYYGGRRADRENMSIGENNEPLSKATWHYAGYDIIYDANGGSGAPEQQIGSRDSETCLSEKTPTRWGYTFQGWSLDKDAETAEWTAGSEFTWSGDDDAVTVYAVWKETVLSGNCGEGYYDDEGWKPDNNATWALNLATGVLTISGSGNMAAYGEDGQEPEWMSWGYGNSVCHVVIESGIESIGSDAFSDCGSLSSVTIADSVESIGSGAFAYCVSLKSLTIPDSVTFIDASAFTGCTGLETIVLPSKLETLELSLFDNCTGLKSVTIPDSVTEIGCYAFRNCTSLESITIPAGAEKIIRYAFQGCTGLKTVTLSAEAAVIGDNAFAGCSVLADVYYCSDEAGREAMAIPEGNDALEQATWHYNAYTVTYDLNGTEGVIAPQSKEPDETLTLPDTVPAREGYAFLGWAEDKDAVVSDYKPGAEYTAGTSVKLYAVWAPLSGTCGSGLTWTMDVQSGTLTIRYTGEGSGAAMDAYSEGETPWYGYFDIIRNIDIGEGVLTIGKGVFSGCTALVSVTIPEGVKTFCEGAFYNCTALENVTLPTTVTKIEEGAFYGCSSLKNVYYGGTETEAAAIEIRSFNEKLKDADWHYNYVVSYDLNGAEGRIEPQTKVSGETLTLSEEIPVREGYVFLGWDPDSDAKTASYAAGGDYSADASVTLYAVWEAILPLTAGRSYKASVISNGGKAYYGFTPSNSQTYVLYTTGVSVTGGGENIMLEESQNNEGREAKITLYNAEGKVLATGTDRLAYLMTAGTAYRIVIGYTDGAITGDIPFTFGRVYTVKYKANGGTGAPAAQTWDYGKTLTLSDAVPARAGYSFEGWAADSTAKTASYTAGAEYHANGNVTLYAVWTKTGEDIPLTANRSYTAQIDEAGDAMYYTFTPAAAKTYAITAGEGVKITLCDEKGTVLAGSVGSLVCLLSADTTYRIAIGYTDETATGNITFSFGREYTMKYKANGGTGAPSVQTWDYGTTLTISKTVPVRLGCSFLGWCANSTAGTVLYAPGAAYTVYGNVTMYAVWADSTQTLKNVGKYTANIENAGGTVYYEYTPTADKTYVLYTADQGAKLTLYDADGKVLASDSSRVACAMTAGRTYLFAVSLSDVTATGSVKLTFGRVYTVKYKANGGTGAPAAQTRDYGTSLTLSNTVPTREGYTFLGWSANGTAETAAYKAGDAYTANGNVTLYAVWKAD